MHRNSIDEIHEGEENLSSDDLFREHSRLAETYAKLPNYKLEEVAKDPSQLTDEAFNVLQLELHKRGMKVGTSGLSIEGSTEMEGESHVTLPENSNDNEPVIEIVDPDSNLSGWVAISQTRNYEHAEYLYKLIKSSGVECILTLSNGVDHYQGVEKHPDNIKICVKEQDAETVENIFDYAYPPKLMMNPEDLYLVKKCPACGSKEIKNQALQVNARGEDSLDAEQEGHEPRWECLDCGHRWQS